MLAYGKAERGIKMNGERYLNIDIDELADGVLCSAVKEIFSATGSKILLEADEASAQIKLLCDGEPWLRYKLRDRRFDGPGWRPTPLTDWHYGGAVDCFTLGAAVEESVYCLDPRYPLTDRFLPEVAAFIMNPFAHLPFEDADKEHLKNWLALWRKVVVSEDRPFPGYFRLRNIKAARKTIHENIVRLLRKRYAYGDKRYTHLTAVPTWWHTTQTCEYLGFSFQYAEDRNALRLLNERLTGKDRARSSWIVMLQFWAELAERNGFCPERDFAVERGTILRDDIGRLITFPLSPERNLWMICKL